jgi:hypothetical protein
LEEIFMKFAKLVVLTAMSAVAATSAHAQTVNCSIGGIGGELNLTSPSTCLVSDPLTANVVKVARMTITGNNITLTTPGATAFSDLASTSLGVVDNGPSISVSSNTAYTVTASSAATWGGTGSGTKPASDLLIKVGAGAFGAIGTIGTGAAATDLTSYVLQYKTKYTWTVDTPGSYTLTVNYTLTAP